MKEDHGERQEFAALVQAHSRALFRAARALLDSDAAAEDAVGEAVLLAWQAFPRLRRRESARAWLLKITVNCAYDQRRRARPTVPLEEAACAAAPAQEPLGLWELVQALPEAAPGGDALLLRRPVGGGDRPGAGGAPGDRQIPPVPGPGQAAGAFARGGYL